MGMFNNFLAEKIDCPGCAGRRARVRRGKAAFDSSAPRLFQARIGLLRGTVFELGQIVIPADLDPSVRALLRPSPEVLGRDFWANGGAPCPCGGVSGRIDIVQGRYLRVTVSEDLPPGEWGFF